jgi:hypothetical protein
VKLTFALLAAGAVLQLAIPAQAASPVVMVKLCGGGAPIPLPTKNHDPDQQCCKICHSARRERGGADSCSSKDGGDDTDE